MGEAHKALSSRSGFLQWKAFRLTSHTRTFYEPKMAPDRKLAQYQPGPVNFRTHWKQRAQKQWIFDVSRKSQETHHNKKKKTYHHLFIVNFIVNIVWASLPSISSGLCWICKKKKKTMGKKTLTPCLLSSFSSGPLHRSKLVCSSRSFCRFSPKLLNKKQNKGKNKNAICLTHRGTSVSLRLQTLVLAFREL